MKKFKRNITTPLSWFYIEIMTASSVMMFATFLICPMNMKLKIFGAIFVPLVVLGVFLVINYLICLFSCLFIKKTFVLDGKSISSDSKIINYDDVSLISFDSGIIGKTTSQPSVLTLFDKEYKALLSIKNIGFIPMFMVISRCKQAKLKYENIKRYFIFLIFFAILGVVLGIVFHNS